MTVRSRSSTYAPGSRRPKKPNPKAFEGRGGQQLLLKRLPFCPGRDCQRLCDAGSCTCRACVCATCRARRFAPSSPIAAPVFSASFVHPRLFAVQPVVLTKRPERMCRLILSWRFHKMVRTQISTVVAPAPANGWAHIAWCGEGFFDNVWLGVSIENRRFVHRADALRHTPAAMRFISAEPLLGPLLDEGYNAGGLSLADIDWLIVGGESGPDHRRIDEGWVRDLRDAAADAGTAFFFKQWGGRTPKAGGRELDGRTWDELPARAVAA